MNKQYKKEKFESRDSCLIWCADTKPIYDHDGDLVTSPTFWQIFVVEKYWQEWHKAIEIVPEKRVIEVWVNVYDDSIYAYGSEARAEQNKSLFSIGTVKLSREIAIVDGKVVEEC